MNEYLVNVVGRREHFLEREEVDTNNTHTEVSRQFALFLYVQAKFYQYRIRFTPGSDPTSDPGS